MRFIKKSFLVLGMLVPALMLLMPDALPFQLKKGKAVIVVKFRLPNGYEFTSGTPSKLKWKVNNPGVIQFEKASASDFQPTGSSYDYEIPFATNPGSAMINLKMSVYYCDQTSRMCGQSSNQANIPVVIAKSGDSNFPYTWSIKPKKPKTTPAWFKDKKPA